MTAQFHQDFANDLAAIPEVSTATEGRVFPLLIDSSDALPAISFNILAGNQDSFYVGSFGLTDYTVDINIYSRSYSTNQTLVDALTGRYNGTRVLLNNSTLAQRAIVENIINTLDNADSKVYRTTVQLTLTV